MHPRPNLSFPLPTFYHLPDGAGPELASRHVPSSTTFLISTNTPPSTHLLRLEHCARAQSCPALCHPWTVAPHALSMAFPKQEHWNGLPRPSPGELPNPGIKPRSPALAGRFFTTKAPRKPKMKWSNSIFNQQTCLYPQNNYFLIPHPLGLIPL